MKVWLIWQNDYVLAVFHGDATEKAQAYFSNRTAELDRQMDPTSWSSLYTKQRPDVWKIHTERDGGMHAHCGRIARLLMERVEVQE